MSVIIRYQAIIPPKGRLIPKISRAQANTAARLFVAEAVTFLKKYPPKPQGSRYVRKGSRGGAKSGWDSEIDVFGSDLDIDIFNDISYVGFIQGRRFAKGNINQTKRAQRQGWPSLTDVDREIWPKWEVRIGRALGIKVRRVNLV